MLVHPLNTHTHTHTHTHTRTRAYSDVLQAPPVPVDPTSSSFFPLSLPLFLSLFPHRPPSIPSSLIVARTHATMGALRLSLALLLLSCACLAQPQQKPLGAPPNGLSVVVDPPAGALEVREGGPVGEGLKKRRRSNSRERERENRNFFLFLFLFSFPLFSFLSLSLSLSQTHTHTHRHTHTHAHFPHSTSHLQPPSPQGHVGGRHGLLSRRPLCAAAGGRPPLFAAAAAQEVEGHPQGPPLR